MTTATNKQFPVPIAIKDQPLEPRHYGPIPGVRDAAAGPPVRLPPGIRDMDDRRTEITGVTEWPDAERRILTHVGWSEGSRCGIAMLEPGVTADYATVKRAVFNDTILAGR